MHANMELDKHKYYAVLTGDIVGSTRFRGEARINLHTCLAKAAGALEENFPGIIPYPVDFFRGDSWQLFLAKPSDSLRIALYFRAAVKVNCALTKIDTRVAIGIGEVDFLPPDNISSGDGVAFRLSGKGLESLSKPVHMGLFLPDVLASDLASALDMIVKLIDLKAAEWTQKQAKCLTGVLLGKSQKEIASRYTPKPISQQAVSQHLIGAGWRTIAMAVELFEKQLSDMLQNNAPAAA